MPRSKDKDRRESRDRHDRHDRHHRNGHMMGPPFDRGPPRGPPPMMRGPPPGPYGPHGPHGPRMPPGPHGPHRMPPHPMMGPPGHHRDYEDYYERSRTPPGRGRALSPGRESRDPSEVQHLPLARCRVLYLGSAVPTETRRGLEAVQTPLRERFPLDADDMAGIDSWLTVFSSGVMMQYVADMDADTWFPIQTLHVCAAVKCCVHVNGITGERGPRFSAIDSRDAANSNFPPIFCSIMRRTRGRKVLECHAFITKSEESAMTLVQATVHAFKHKEGWCSSEPPQARIRQAIHLIPADPSLDERQRSDFQRPPPKEGYFYSSNKEVIRSYNVKERDMGHPYMGDPYGAPGAPKVGQLPSHPRNYFNGWNDFDDTVFVNNGPLSDEIYARNPGSDHGRRQRSVSPPRSVPNGRSHNYSPPRRASPPRQADPYRRRSPPRHYDSDDDMFARRPTQATAKKDGPAVSSNFWIPTDNVLAGDSKFKFGAVSPRATKTQPSNDNNFSYGLPKNDTPKPQPAVNNEPRPKPKESSSNNNFHLGQPVNKLNQVLPSGNANFSFGALKKTNASTDDDNFSFGQPKNNRPSGDDNFSFGPPKTRQASSSADSVIDNGNFSFGPPNIPVAPPPPPVPAAPISSDNPLANLASYSRGRRGDVRNLFAQ